MAVTRIKNNQITDSTINAAAKVQGYTITGGLLANNLTYGSDFTVQGNLVVQGNTTTIDTNITTIEDPVIVLASTQTGSPTVDIGFLGERGTEDNIAFVWDESQGKFITAYTTTAETNTTISISSYASFKTLDSEVTGNLAVTGTTSLTGNVTTGNIFIGTGKTIDAGNNIIGNVAEPLANADAATKLYVDSQVSGAVSFDITDGTTTETVSNGDTIAFTGTANQVSVVVSAPDTVTFSLPTDVTIAGNLLANKIDSNTTISATGNVTAGNVDTIGQIVATGNVSSGNVLTSGLMSATGNVTGGNVDTTGQVTATGNVTGGNLSTSGQVTATGNVTGGNVLTSGLMSATGNVTGGNLDTSGQVVASGNVNGGNVISSALVQGVTLSASGNTISGNVTTTGLITATGNITGGNIDTTGQVTATGNVTGGNLVTSGQVTAVGNVTGGNVITGNIWANTLSLSGGATFDYVTSNTYVSAVGNVISGNVTTTGIVTASGNVIAGNITTAGQVSATSNIIGGNVLTNTLTTVSGDLTLNAAGGDLDWAGAGNVRLGNRYINDLADPVANQDGATKAYVDNMVSTGIAYHPAVYVATTANLATTTGGTITYSQPNGAGNGVGALITTTGSFNLIDTANVQTANTRILVKDEGNAVLNGVYYWANSTAIIRTIDADEYGPNSAEQLSINDYFFVQQGNVNAGSAWVVDSPTGTITFGTSNIQFAQFSSSQTYSANTAAGISILGTVISAKVDNDTTAFDGGGNISVKAGANLTTPNIGNATGNSLTLLGNGVLQATTVSATGNITGGNIDTAGVMSATGNITSSGNVAAGNLLTTGQMLATGNVTGANMLTGGLISAVGNLDAGNVNTGGLISAVGNAISGNVLTSGLISATGNITGGNVDTTGQVTATGNVTGGNLLTGGIMLATGNVTGGNVLTSGQVSATGNVTGGNVNTSGNVTGGNLLTGGEVSATGNVTGGNLITTGTFQSASISATGNITGGNIFSLGLLTATGNITGGNISTTGNMAAGGVLTDNLYYANGTPWDLQEPAGSNYQIQFNYGNDFAASANLTFDDTTNVFTVIGTGNITGNVTGGNFDTTGLITATGNVTGGNILTIGLMSATGNVTGGNVDTTGQVTATGNVTGGNILTAGEVSATGNVSGDNLKLNTGSIDGAAAGTITINGSSSDTDFAVNGDTTANVFYVDAGTGTASFGSSTQTTNAIVAFNATNSVLMPVGNTAQRPAVPVEGMLRYNTTIQDLELYDADEWKAVGTPVFTVIVDDQFNGDGSTVAFTLSQSSTTAGVVVSINGVVQIPTTAYSVSGTTLTFTEAPLTGDVIDVRIFTTTTTVTGIENSSGNASITTSPTSDTILIEGNLIPSANITYNLGNSTNWWKDGYFAGNTIYLGGLQMKASGNTFAVYTADGITQANIDAGSIDVSSIASGTSAIGLAAPNGNAYVTVGGQADRLVVSTAGIEVTGTASATGTITGGNVATAGTVSATGTITGGNVATAGTVSATGTITGGNLVTGGTASVTGTITGGNVATAGTISATGNITGGNVINNNLTAGRVTFAGTNKQLTDSSNLTWNNGTSALGVTGSVSATGTITGGDLSTVGNVTAGGITLNANTISSTGTTLTIDPSAVGVTGLVVIAGNLQVQGTTTTIDSTTITTNDLVINMANNAATASAANGGGIAVGPAGADYASITYNSTANIWTISNGANTPGILSATGNVTGGNLLTGGLISATGNITGGNLSGTNVTGTLLTAAQPNVTSLGTLSSLSVTGNINGGNLLATTLVQGVTLSASGNVVAGNVTTAGLVSATGNITGGNLSVGTGTVSVGNIVNTNANGVGNIGSASLYFNTVFAKATSAQYADLAEMYEADGVIEPGTVVCFGGSKEVTTCGEDGSRRVAGVVSTNPSYIMNAGLAGDNVVAVALTGRVPTKVTGSVRKGDMLVAAGSGRARAEANPEVGAVIGKALADFDGADGTIEVVVGRL